MVETMAPAAGTDLHARFIAGVRDVMVKRAVALATITPEEAARIMAARVFYGTGLGGGYRGITAYGTWKSGGKSADIVEIAAAAQESYLQLACTTVHEFGHVIAGRGTGHSGAWVDRCESLGFAKRPEAAGMRYTRDSLAPSLMASIDTLALSIGADRPAFTRGLSAGMAGLAGLFRGMGARPCSAGIGTHGGKSRGIGSGSRLRLWECQCARPVKVRVASDTFAATCKVCGADFAKVSPM